MQVTTYNEYNRPVDKGTVNNLPTRTVQSFENEVNINKIMARIQKGHAVPIQQGSPLYDDFTSVSSFHEANNKLIEANDAFMKLSPTIRAEFDNSPAQLMAFIQNPENKEHAIKIGLIAKPVKPPEELPKRVIVVTPEPEAKK
ncbi:MAG: internal scaffolding protein [Arizlama microvirus]|nr:MAG: internal scaffolding protein [Arizlama microvirus]